MLYLRMKITTAEDWQKVHTVLSNQLREIAYNPDLRKLLNNISNMVVELSKVEVTARRTKKNVDSETINKINDAIDRLEKIIIIAKLSQ